MMLVFSVGTIWLRLSVVRTTYEIGQLDQMIKNKMAEKQKAVIESTRAKSPEKLERLAKSKFNLSTPSTAQIIHLKAPEAEDGD